MDALSDVLSSVSLSGAVYFDAEFTAPWCVRGRYGIEGATERLAGADHIIYFHLLTEGRCLVRLLDGDEVIEVSDGGLVLFPMDDHHLIGSDLDMPPLSQGAGSASRAANDGRLVVISAGGGGEVTRFVCGYLACDRALCRPLLEALPRMARITLDGPNAALIRELLREAVRESSESRPGGESKLAKLSELVFIEALRRHAESLPKDGTGWLAGLRDPQVGRALALVHRTPARDWTVDELAREVAMSRSALAERFTELVGDPPMKYLTRLRLALAARMLRTGSEPLVRIAEQAGYGSEAAFSRAFKREFGRPPAAWRHSRR